MFTKLHLALAFLLICTLQCRNDDACSKVNTSSSFYHWRTRFSLSDQETKAIQTLGTDRLYLRYTDLDFDENKRIAFVGPTHFEWERAAVVHEVVPVFFIVNRVFQQMDTAQSILLAQRCIDFLMEQTPERVLISEVQLDCDWSKSTREGYFRFIEDFKAALEQTPRLRHAQVSATIRLHQIRYPDKTGVPPVAKGLLMLYNFDNPTRPEVKNSILDADEAKAYLNKARPYQIPLDVALPLFSWGVHFREKAFQGFIRGLRTDQADQLSFLSRMKKNIYQVREDTAFQNTYFRAGDWIRIEEPSRQEIRKVWCMAQPLLNQDSCRIIYFDLSPENLNKFPAQSLKTWMK